MFVSLRRVARSWQVSALLALASIGAACNYGVLPTSPTDTSTTASSTSSSGTGSGTATPSALTYVKDVQPILSGACVRCHGPSRRDAGIDVSTYANVMRLVAPGNANSLLIAVTRQGGLMYSQLGSNASQKASTIRDWIVTANAVQQ